MKAVFGLRSLGVLLAISFSVAACLQPDSYEVAMTASDQAFKDKQYDAAENGYLRAVEFAEKTYRKGEGESDLIQGLKALAECYAAQHKYSDAEQQYLRASQLVESKVGKDMMKTGKLSPDFENWVATLMSLADTYREEGKFVEAEKTYKRVVALEDKLTSPNKDIKAKAQSELAECYAKQGKNKEAKELRAKLNAQTK